MGFITYPKHAAHLAIPAVIYLKDPRPPRLGDASSSWVSSYILNTPPNGAIPVYHTYLNTPLIWRFRLSYTLNKPPDWAIPVHHIYLNTPLIWRFRVSYTFNTPDQGGSSYILNTPPDWAIPVQHFHLNTPLAWRLRLYFRVIRFITHI